MTGPRRASDEKERARWDLTGCSPVSRRGKGELNRIRTEKKQYSAGRRTVLRRTPTGKIQPPPTASRPQPEPSHRTRDRKEKDPSTRKRTQQEKQESTWQTCGKESPGEGQPPFFLPVWCARPRVRHAPPHKVGGQAEKTGRNANRHYSKSAGPRQRSVTLRQWRTKSKRLRKKKGASSESLGWRNRSSLFGTPSLHSRPLLRTGPMLSQDRLHNQPSQKAKRRRGKAKRP